MSNLSFIEDKISPFISEQFPSVYRDDGELMVLFTKAYYEHLEDTNQSLDYSRNLLQYGTDVDQSITSFLDHFKKTYLFSIPEEASMDVGFVVKHILDLYRSKGSERCVKLLFKLLYGKNADIYVPNVHILRASDAEYVTPRYIECYEPDNDKLKKFLGKFITGETSGATAYVTSIVGTSVAGTLLSILFLEQLKGEFIRDELFKIDDGTSIRTYGSLSGMTITDGGNDYSVGDLLDIKSSANTSTDGIVRVLTTKDGTGIPEFTIQSPGSGFSSNSSISNVVVASVVLQVNNISNTFTSAQFDDTNTSFSLSTRPANTFDLFETVYAPKVVLTYTSANANFYNSVNTATYVNGINSTGGVVANGKIADITGNTSTGNLFVYEISSFSSGVTTLQIGGNSAANATLDTFTNAYAQGTFIGMQGNNLGLTGNNIAFSVSDEQVFVKGTTSNTYADVLINLSGSESNVTVNSVFNTVAAKVYTNYLNESGSGNVAFMSMKIDGSDSNVTSNGYGFSKNTAANVNSVIDKALTFQDELIGEVLSLTINDTGNTFSGDPPVLVQNKFVDNKISLNARVTYTNQAGAALAAGDMVRQSTAVTGKTLTFSSTVNVIPPGEGVVQVVNSTVNVFGTVVNSNSSSLVLENIKQVTDGNLFHLTTNAVTFQTNTSAPITGLLGGNTVNVQLTSAETNTTTNTVAVGKVLSINTTAQTIDLRMHSPNAHFFVSTSNRLQTNNNSKSVQVDRVSNIDDSYNRLVRTGVNANVTSNVEIGTGIVSSVQVVDSGYRFKNGESVTIKKNGTTQLIEGTAIVNGTGLGVGYHRKNSGALNEEYYIHDNNFYQTFSYQVLSEFELNRYEKVLKQIIHTAGYKLFGKVVSDSFANNEVSLEFSDVSQA